MSAASPVIKPEPAAAPDRLGRWGPVFARLQLTEWSGKEGGGYVDDPEDRGGATKYGVSLRWLLAQGRLSPADAQRWDIDHSGALDWRDVAAMTLADAEEIYYRFFWIRPGVYRLPEPFDAALFDQVVNAGEAAAVKLLQQALNETLADIGSMATLRVDGVLGSFTEGRLRAAVAIRKDRLLNAYRAHAAGRYRAIVAADPSQARFLDGWLKRASELGDV